VKGQLELARGQVRRLPSRTEAELAQEAGALEERLASAQYAVDRLAHLVHQLLTLSRADQTTRDASNAQQVR
jgi:signal transduction histidine kinase